MLALAPCAFGLSEGVWYAIPIPKRYIFGYTVLSMCAIGLCTNNGIGNQRWLSFPQILVLLPLLVQKGWGDRGLMLAVVAVVRCGKVHRSVVVFVRS